MDSAVHKPEWMGREAQHCRNSEMSVPQGGIISSAPIRQVFWKKRASEGVA